MRLRRAVGRGAGAAWGLVGRHPGGTGARFGRGAVRVFTPGPEPSKGRSPASDPCRKAVQRRLGTAKSPLAHPGWAASHGGAQANGTLSAIRAFE